MLTVLNFGGETEVQGSPVITWGCHHGVKAAWLGRGSWSQHCGSLPGQCGSGGRESVCNAGDLGSILGLERSPGEGNGNLLQYACLENPMDREAWQATVHGVVKNWTLRSD